MSNVWFTSDLHIGHKHVAQERAVEFGAPAVACRPDVAVAWYDEHLAWKWDELVGKDDVVWVLGDLCLQGTRVTNNALEWLRGRPGRKHLIAGNHDNIHPGIERGFAPWATRYLDVFNTVGTFARKRIAGKNVLMSHFPYQGSGDHTFEERYTQWRLPDMGEWLLHGHTHSAEKRASGPKSIHVGVDAWDLSPVPMSAIEEIINEC